MKTIILSTALVAFGAPAFAGPFVNIEANSSFEGSNYGGTTVTNDVGYENKLGEKASYYIQGGPALVFPDSGDSTVELHAKTGINADLTKRVGVYGEVAAMTQDSINMNESLKLGTKVGIKYTF
ncbi:MAG: hypothetical protein CL779_00675 [Chloroflexi bacterium]|nr:hypothetical protein [Chloroflexota bacterium]